MKKKLVAAGVLAGGIALTGVAGSTVAASAASAGGGKATTAPVLVKGHGPIAIACHSKGGHIKGKREKGAISIKEGKLPPLPAGAPTIRTRSGGKALPAPPSGAEHLKIAKGAVKVTAKGDAPGTIRIGPLPKGVHCAVVKPGTPGAPPAPPAR
jgi:hypothetical protein